LKKYDKPDWVWAAARRNKCNRTFAQTQSGSMI